MKKVAIIGGGASGLFCAILCAKNGCKVTLFEQNNKLAKKILVSGNGRCNITNTQLSAKNYHSNNKEFVTFALESFGYKQFKKMVQSFGLLLTQQEDGRVFPLSYEAKNVAYIFENLARSLGVDIHLNAKITSLENFFVKYDAVVVATGSQAASHLGGSEDGMEFAKEYGHSVIDTFASLVQLEIENKHLHKMAGVKTYAELTLFVNHQQECSISGDLLFTNYGISGLAVLDISHHASEALHNYNHVSIEINLLPTFTQQKLANHLMGVANNRQHATLLELLMGLVAQKVSIQVLQYLQLNTQQLAQTLTPKMAKKIANTLLHWRFEVKQTHGFRHAEVSGGGINTQEINPKTMESLKKKNLYFTGEVLDVVGDRGGYNFAFAWASAYLVAQDILLKP
jgi:predicted Rossmann fold flavoprotein